MNNVILKCVSPFKSGSSTWSYRLGEIAKKIGCDFNEDKHDTWMSEELGRIRKCIFLVTVRNPSHIYPSAFFEDLATPGYPYYLPDYVNLEVPELVEHYLKFPWHMYEHVNYYEVQRIIESLTGLIPNIEDFYQNPAIIKKENVIFLLFPFSQMNNIPLVTKYMNDCLYLMKLPQLSQDEYQEICQERFYQSQDKEYAKKYKEFLQILYNEF